MTAAQSAITVEGLSKRFGGLTALDDVSFSVPAGTITAVIGPNGAGKTTLFNLLTGLSQPSAGVVRYFGRSVAGLRSEEIAFRHGVGRTFQNIRLFRELTVLENLMIGCHRRLKAEFIASIFKPYWVREEERKVRQMAREALALVGLEHKGEVSAGELPYGQQRRVEIARALALEPSVILLDEPAAGMTQEETDHLGALIRHIRALGVTVLLVEHRLDLVMSNADRVVVLQFGRVISTGAPAEVQADTKVIEAYLGSGVGYAQRP